MLECLATPPCIIPRTMPSERVQRRIDSLLNEADQPIATAQELRMEPLLERVLAQRDFLKA